MQKVIKPRLQFDGEVPRAMPACSKKSTAPEGVGEKEPSPGAPLRYPDSDRNKNIHAVHDFHQIRGPQFMLFYSWKGERANGVYELYQRYVTL